MSGRVRVAHVTYECGYGGIQEALRLLCGSSRLLEHVVVARGGGPLLEAFRSTGVRVEMVPEGKITSTVAALGADVVVTHTANGNSLWEYRHCAELAATGFPVVLYYHCALPLQAPLSLFSGVVTSSAHNWRMLGSPSRALVLPFGFTPPEDAGMSKREAKRHFGLEPDSYVVGRVSRFSNSKCIPHTLMAAAEAGRILAKPVQVLVAGGEDEVGSVRKGVEEVAELLGIVDLLVMPGSLDLSGKLVALAALDVYLAPTWCEGYGLVFCEAMQVGVPVVTYDDGPNSETVGPGGYAVPFGDINALGRVTAELLDNETLRSTVGGHGRALVLARNSIERYVTELENYLVSVVDSDRSPRTEPDSHSGRPQGR